MCHFCIAHFVLLSRRIPCTCFDAWIRKNLLRNPRPNICSGDMRCQYHDVKESTTSVLAMNSAESVDFNEQCKVFVHIIRSFVAHCFLKYTDCYYVVHTESEESETFQPAHLRDKLAHDQIRNQRSLNVYVWMDVWIIYTNDILQFFIHYITNFGTMSINSSAQFSKFSIFYSSHLKFLYT